MAIERIRFATIGKYTTATHELEYWGYMQDLSSL